MAGIGVEAGVPIEVAASDLQTDFDDDCVSGKSMKNVLSSPHLYEGNTSDPLLGQDGSAPVQKGNVKPQEEDTGPAIIQTPEQKYAKFGQVIDALSTRNDLSLLNDAVIELQSHAQQLKLFREDVQSHRLYRDRR